jgi:hypothetical protein
VTNPKQPIGLDVEAGRSEPRSLQKFIAQRRRDFDGVEQADSPALENGVQGGMHGRLHVAIAT